MIRPHVRDLVELCMHAREPHAGESLRKRRWKRAKEEQLRRLAELEKSCAEAAGDRSDELEESATAAEAALPATVALQCESPVVRSRVGKDLGAARTLDELVMEIQRADVSITSRRVESNPSDPLGAISVPLFGGRVLQDTAILRPHAVMKKDPLQLERTRYTYSNAVYVYDTSTRLWRFQECAGAPPQERSDHTALFLAPDHLLVFGGRGRNGRVFRDLYALSLRSWRWWRVDHEHPPMERYWHAWCITDAKEVFLFGGKSDALVFGDLVQIRSSAVTRWLEAQDREHRQQQVASASWTETNTPRRNAAAPPAWAYPTTVGKAPSSRFGMQVMALDCDQIAIVGGWRRGSSSGPAKQVDHSAADQLLDIYILDTVTLLWTKPQVTTLVCVASCVPSARLLFECFYADQTIVVFGGHTYAPSGESEPLSPCQDAARALFLLDLPRMIWRRQEASESLLLPPAHVHSGGSNVLIGGPPGGGYVGLSCSPSFGDVADPLAMALTAFDLPFG